MHSTCSRVKLKEYIICLPPPRPPLPPPPLPKLLLNPPLDMVLTLQKQITFSKSPHIDNIPTPPSPTHAIKCIGYTVRCKELGNKLWKYVLILVHITVVFLYQFTVDKFLYLCFCCNVQHMVLPVLFTTTWRWKKLFRVFSAFDNIDFRTIIFKDVFRHCWDHQDAKGGKVFIKFCVFFHRISHQIWQVYFLYVLT